MRDYKIKRCFTTGLLLFAINMAFGLPKILPIFLLTSNILPGFIFGFTLIVISENKDGKRAALFFLLSGGIYIMAAWIATGYSFLGDDTYVCYPSASVFGAITLLLVYKLLLDASISFLKGISCAIITGLVSSILPIASEKLKGHYHSFLLEVTCMLSVFITWQTLFGWTISQAERAQSTRFEKAQ